MEMGKGERATNVVGLGYYYYFLISHKKKNEEEGKNVREGKGKGKMVKVRVSLLGSTRERDAIGASFCNGLGAEAVDISFQCLYFTFLCLNLSRFVLSQNWDGFFSSSFF